jgi:hypothetical protein
LNKPSVLCDCWSRLGPYKKQSVLCGDEADANNSEALVLELGVRIMNFH